jgi:putative Holliday junction resolvase
VRFVEWDERFTTRLAGSRDRNMGTVRVDHLAAARMLQEYLGAGEGL